MFRAPFGVVLGCSLLAFANEVLADDVIDAERDAPRLERPRPLNVGLFSGAAVYREDAALGRHGVVGSGFVFGARAGALLGDWTADGGTFGDTVGVEVEAAVAYPEAGWDGEEPVVATTALVASWGVNAIVGHLSDRPAHPFTTFGIGGETLLDGRDGESDTDLAIRAGLGLQMRAGPGAIRLEARVAALPGRDDDLTAATRLELGYSVSFGERGPRVGRVQRAGRDELPPPVFLVVRPSPPAARAAGPAPVFATTAPPAGGVPSREAPPLVWSERARLPDDAPPPVWLVSGAR